MPNRNTHYAAILIDELVRAGLRHVCLAPGSRNTPLVLACANHAVLRISSHLDERSAAFFALGIALATDAPAAIICTSGSAAANFFPAIVEAHQSCVPLLVLTADRPHELRHSGANQTIDQIKLFGDFVLWSVDAPLPEAVPPAVVTRNLRTLAARAFATANGIRKGVVHVNVPFRPPLEPVPVVGDATDPAPGAHPRADYQPYTHFVSTRQQHAASDEVASLGEYINRHERGIIVCGPRGPTGEFGALVAELGERAGYPVLADGVSGLRPGCPGVMGGYDTFLAGEHLLAAPDVVIRFGAVPTSKALNQYLDAAAAPVVMHIRQNGVWADDSHRISHFVQADEAAFLRAVLPVVVPRQNEQHTAWYASFRAAEAVTWQAIDAEPGLGIYFDGAAVYDTLDLLPSGTSLFVGNSLAVRHLDQFCKPTDRPMQVFANRGASGIDGNLSTALGIGYAQPDRPVVALVGDITFYHDMNGLLAVRRCGVPIIIVLLHNDGGGIFHRLPISQHEPDFTPYFVTPHGLDFSHAAYMYGLDYVQVDERDAFRRVFAECVARQQSTIIEVRTDAQRDFRRWQEITATVQARLKQRAASMGRAPDKEHNI